MLRVRHIIFPGALLALLSVSVKPADPVFREALTGLEERDYRKAGQALAGMEPDQDIISYMKIKTAFHLQEYTNVINNGPKELKDRYLENFRVIYTALSLFALGQYGESAAVISGLDVKKKIFRAVRRKITADCQMRLGSLSSAFSNYSRLILSLDTVNYYNHQVKTEFFGRSFEQDLFGSLLDIACRIGDGPNLIWLLDNFLYLAKENKKALLEKADRFIKSSGTALPRRTAVLLGQEFYFLNKREEATNYLNPFLARRTNDTSRAKALFTLALLYREQPEISRSLLELLTVSFGFSDESLYYAARAHYLSGNYSESASLYQKVIQNGADTKITRDSCYDLTALYKKMNNREEARRTARLYYTQFPRDRAGHELYYKTALEELNGGNLSAAAAILRDLLSSGYYRREAAYFLGRLLEKEKKTDEALDHYWRVLETGGPDYYFIRSLLAVKNLSFSSNLLSKFQTLKNDPLEFHFMVYLITGEEKSRRTVMEILDKKHDLKKLFFGDRSVQLFENEAVRAYGILASRRLFIEANIVYRDLLKDLDTPYRVKIYKKLLFFSVGDTVLQDSLNMRLNIFYNLKLDRYRFCLDRKYMKYLYPGHYMRLIRKNAGKINDRIPLSLILSLVREESRFDRGALSPSLAVGLFQVMPATARHMERQFNYRHGKSLFNPGVNSTLGIRFLNGVLKEFANDVLALSAYNAGPARVRSWLKQNPYNGDFPEAFIDLIPFSETRNYVKKISVSRFFYEQWLGE